MSGLEINRQSNCKPSPKQKKTHPSHHRNKTKKKTKEEEFCWKLFEENPALHHPIFKPAILSDF
jgi:hypothetical protein